MIYKGFEASHHHCDYNLIFMKEGRHLSNHLLPDFIPSVLVLVRSKAGRRKTISLMLLLVIIMVMVMVVVVVELNIFMVARPFPRSSKWIWDWQFGPMTARTWVRDLVFDCF